MMLPPAVPPPDQFQMPDVSRLGPMPSLPAWVASRVAWLKTEPQRNPLTKKWEPTLTLPASLVLTEMQTVEVHQHSKELHALCVPSNSVEADEHLMDLLTELVSAKPSQGHNEHSAAALGASFLMALNDLPIWSVEKAIIRFHRGEWGKTEQGDAYDYRWCPPSADLRRIAYAEMRSVKNRAELLDRLLRAVAPEEFSEEHRAKMRERFLELHRDLSTSLVGTDGSGGAAGRKPVDGAYCGTRPRAQPGLKREGGRRRHGYRRK